MTETTTTSGTAQRGGWATWARPWPESSLAGATTWSWATPHEGLVDELTALGAEVVAVDGVRNLAEPEATPKLVAAGLERFGRIDAAAAFTGQIVGGRFMKSSVDDLHKVVEGCLEAPYHFLKAVARP